MQRFINPPPLNEKHYLCVHSDCSWSKTTDIDNRIQNIANYDGQLVYWIYGLSALRKHLMDVHVKKKDDEWYSAAAVYARKWIVKKNEYEQCESHDLRSQKRKLQETMEGLRKKARRKDELRERKGKAKLTDQEIESTAITEHSEEEKERVLQEHTAASSSSPCSSTLPLDEPKVGKDPMTGKELLPDCDAEQIAVTPLNGDVSLFLFLHDLREDIREFSGEQRSQGEVIQELSREQHSQGEDIEDVKTRLVVLERRGSSRDHSGDGNGRGGSGSGNDSDSDSGRRDGGDGSPPDTKRAETEEQDKTQGRGYAPQQQHSRSVLFWCSLPDHVCLATIAVVALVAVIYLGYHPFSPPPPPHPTELIPSSPSSNHSSSRERPTEARAPVALSTHHHGYELTSTDRKRYVPSKISASHQGTGSSKKRTPCHVLRYTSGEMAAMECELRA